MRSLSKQADETMPKFFLHIRYGDSFVKDREGEDFADLESARREAIMSAREIIADLARAGAKQADRDRIDVCDEFGNVLAIVPFLNALK